MSAPFLDSEDPLQGAISEVVSAISSLNMPAEAIPGAAGYLSQTDATAKHAIEHLHAVFELLRRASAERDALRSQLRRTGFRSDTEHKKDILAVLVGRLSGDRDMVPGHLDKAELCSWMSARDELIAEFERRAR